MAAAAPATTAEASAGPQAGPLPKTFARLVSRAPGPSFRAAVEVEEAVPMPEPGPGEVGACGVLMRPLCGHQWHVRLRGSARTTNLSAKSFTHTKTRLTRRSWSGSTTRASTEGARPSGAAVEVRTRSPPHVRKRAPPCKAPGCRGIMPPALLYALSCTPTPTGRGVSLRSPAPTRARKTGATPWCSWAQVGRGATGHSAHYVCVCGVAQQPLLMRAGSAVAVATPRPPPHTSVQRAPG